MLAYFAAFHRDL